MAFLHWRAKLLARFNNDDRRDKVSQRTRDRRFCRTLCLGQLSQWGGDGNQWLRICYHSFASLIRQRLPYLELDEQLRWYIDQDGDIPPDDRRRVLHLNCTSKMMGRRFFITSTGLLGMGSGLLEAGDIICIPLGCSTPVIIRRDVEDGYRFVGDTYVDSYMDGQGIDEWHNNMRSLRSYVLH